MASNLLFKVINSPEMQQPYESPWRLILFPVALGQIKIIFHHEGQDTKHINALPDLTLQVLQ